MASIVDDLLDLFADTVTVETPAAFDSKGVPSGYGAARTYRARVRGKRAIVRDLEGQERVSQVEVLLAGVYSVTTTDRFTLPARFVPQQPKALWVEIVPDETGPVYEKVLF